MTKQNDYIVHTTKVNNGANTNWKTVRSELARFEIKVRLLNVRDVLERNEKGLYVTTPGIVEISVLPREGHADWATAALAQEVADRYFEGSGYRVKVELLKRQQNAGARSRMRSQAVVQREKMERAVLAFVTAPIFTAPAVQKAIADAAESARKVLTYDEQGRIVLTDEAEASLSNEYDDGNGMVCSTDGCDNLVGGN